jgi:hypothetical protein
MKKTHMKRVSLTLLVVLMLTFAAIPMAFAITPSLSINVSPSSGTVPRTVRVYGHGASPCGDVEIWWDEDGQYSALDVRLGVTEADRWGCYEIWVEIPDAFCGTHDITAWDIASGHSAGTKFTVKPQITLDPSSGPVGTEVAVEGTGFKRNVQIDIYYDGRLITTHPAIVMTDGVGSFLASFIVPESVFGSHTVKATDRYDPPCWDEEKFFVESKIVLDPTQGPCGTKVTITGTGFDGCDLVDISFTCCCDKTWWFNEVTETNEKGSFTYIFTIPCTLADGDGCCNVCPGPWWIDARTESTTSEEKFIVTPWFTIDPLKGPVGTEVTASGYGFDVESVDIIFRAFPGDIVVKEDVPTDEMGNFVTTFEVPEVVEGYYKVSANGIMATKCCGEDLYFEVLPWIWITPSEGYVGDTVTVVGKGWDSLRHVDIIYAGIDECKWPLRLIEHIIGPHMALWLTWEETPICCYNKMIILQPWGWVLIAESVTDAKGSFEVTFEVPESPGGYHPIYAGECWSTGRPSKKSANVPVFRVHPKIWVEGHEGESEGLSGEYVTLYGTGFSYVEFWMRWQCYPVRAIDYYFRVGAFVLDFDSNKQWIDEFNFIMNNEYSEGWQEMYWAWLRWIMDGCYQPCPLFPKGYLPVYIDLSGTISHGYWWRWLWLLFYHMGYPVSEAFYEDLTYKGCPFLKVPVLQPGEKELLAYYFGIEVSTSLPFDGVEYMPLDFELEGIVDGIPTMLVEPVQDPMSMLFGFETPEFPIKVGKIYTETASTNFTIKKPGVEVDPSEEVLNRLDELEAKITGLVTNAEGKILAQIETSVGTIQADISNLGLQLTGIQGTLAEIKLGVEAINLDAVLGSLAEIKTSLGTIQGTVVNIDGNIALIKTDIGTVKVDLSNLDSKVVQLQTDINSINGKLVALNDELATIKTSLGTFSASLTDINTKITVMNGNIAKIETDLGTVKGIVTRIDGNTATIMTDIGQMRGTISEIKNDTGLQPATIGLSILAAISAIAAAVMILRKVYLK